MTVSERRTMSNKDFNLSANSFDLLRLIGAGFVLLSHSFRHFNLTKPVWSLFFMDGSIGVMIFFAITGFLIMPAWERSQKKEHPYKSYFWNRIIRIYPGIIFSFLLITLIDGLLIKENVFSLNYLVYMFKYCILSRGSQYGANGLSNGVLWTILPDIVYYILTPFIWKFLKKLKTWQWILLIVVFWQFNIFDSWTISVFKQIPLFGKLVGDGFPLCFMYQFLIGSFLYFKRETILAFFIKHKLYAYLWLIAFTAFYEFFYLTDVFPKNWVMHSPVIAIMAVPLSIVMGYALGDHHVKIDISYGVFLIHMIVIGTLKFLGVSGYIGVLLVLVIGPVLALLYCIAIEKPVLKLKTLVK